MPGGTEIHDPERDARWRLADLISDHHAAIVERLCQLAWADPSDTRSIVRDSARVRPRAELFLSLLEDGLRSQDWSRFDEASGRIAVEQMVRRLLTPDQLNERALAIAGILLPLAASQPDPTEILMALFEAMQALGTRVIAAYNECLEAEARELDDVKTLFLRIAGHDLRAPLGVINSYSTMAVSGELGPVPGHLEPMIDATRRSASRALGMLDRVVEVARLESRTEAVRRERASVRELLDAAVEPYREAAREQKVRLDVEADDGAAFVDPEQIVTAIGNLVANAMKYGDAARGGVRATARREGGEVVFEVSDRGPGVAADEVNRLFERFYRSAASAGSGVPGSGLGLYIVKRIAELHGGQVFVESTPGTGSRFGMRVPALDGSARPGGSMATEAPVARDVPSNVEVS